MKILGIDPGTATTGYGIVEYTAKNEFILVDYGLVSTSKELPHGQRLDLIYKGIENLLTKHLPDVVAIERLFFATNALTAIAVGQAIGVIKLAIHHKNVPVFDYAPMQVKLYVGGSGKADKILMKSTVKKMLHIHGSKLNEVKDGKQKIRKTNKTHFDDAADALALAICHVKKLSMPKKK
jgi:crossover junction endodeoxyribonuclease RuvC